MAKGNLSNQQILQLLLATGGNSSKLSSLGATKKDILRALLSSPETVASLRSSVQPQVQKYAQYDPTSTYDNPALAYNELELQYNAYPEKFRNFAMDFFEKVREVGGNPWDVSQLKNKVDKNKDLYLSQTGMSEDEFNELWGQMAKDADKFSSAERKLQKSRFAEFAKQRKAAGIKGTTAGGVTEDYLAAQTGISGLGQAPASLEEFAKQRSSMAAEKLRKRGRTEEYIKALLPEIESKVKKKVGKNYQSYVAADLIKKNLLGG